MIKNFSDDITSHKRDSFYGGLAGFVSFVIWGGLVLYWKALSDIAPIDTVAQRILWSCAVIVPVAYLTRNLPEVRRAFADKATLMRLLVSASVLTINWLLYIWAVTSGRVVEASLGYFINPLVSVLLGRIFLKERLTRLQILAISIAFFGVLWSVVAYGHMPWLGLGVASTFALYGYLHKTVSSGAIASLCTETILIAPFALIWLLYQSTTGAPHFFDYEVQTQLLLMGTGIITTIPLFLFGWASQHISLASLGLLQYVAPTIKLLLGTLLYGEPINAATGVTLVCIWIGLALYSWCNFTQIRAAKRSRIL